MRVVHGRADDWSTVGSRMWYLTSRMRAVWQARSRYLPSWKKSQASPCDIVPSLIPVISWLMRLIWL